MADEVVVPKLNNNDESCVLNQWLVEEGEHVEVGVALAVLETSKATSDLVAERAGFVHRAVATGANCPFGSIAARIFATDAERQGFVARAAAPTDAIELTITRGAQELVDKHAIPVERLRSIGKRVLRAADIEALLESAQPKARSQDSHQQAVARTVSESHATIPAAFLAVRVWCDAAVAALAALSTKHGRLIGIAELLTKIVGTLGDELPVIYGVDRTAAELAAPNVGLTFDLGEGLFIPVVRSPGRRSLPELADILMEYRLKTARGEFKTDDLAGGHLSISLNPEDDVLFSIPIIQPGQTAMISIGSVHTVGATDVRSVLTLGIAYDHRYINGYGAMIIAKTIKARIESAEDVVD